MNLSDNDLEEMREEAKCANSSLSCALDYIEELKKEITALRSVFEAAENLLNYGNDEAVYRMHEALKAWREMKK